jgi:hypothetical protein
VFNCGTQTCTEVTTLKTGAKSTTCVMRVYTQAELDAMYQDQLNYGI